MSMIQHGKMGTARVVDQFEAVDLGAPFKVVLHKSVKASFDLSTGEMTSYQIPDLDGLLRVIAIFRALHPRRLFGADLKFIRKAVSLKQKELAKKVDISAEHLSRFENGKELNLSPQSEKLLRIYILKTAFKLHKLKAGKAKSKLEDALDKLFECIEPTVFFDVNKPLEMHFHRSRPGSLEKGSEEFDANAQWDGEEFSRAA